MSSFNYKNNTTEKMTGIYLSSSMMTFREYYMKFIGVNDPCLTNGWGWFVDIELNSEPIKINNNNQKFHHQKYIHSSKYTAIPKTIKEYPSIRSMKSLNNLYNTSMMFEMDDDSKHRTNKNISTILYYNTVGIITVAILCYSLYFKQ